MSISAISWALDQDIYPSTAKFVLVCLCDYCGMDNKVFPSIKTLCRKTSQDRKTVISSLDRLEEIGLIQHVGARNGGIKEYSIIGLPDSSNHYVYRLTHIETGEFYIGLRSCYCNPSEDKYYGSGRWPQEVCREKLSKEIIGIFKTRQEAEITESFLINKHKDDLLFKNKFSPKIIIQSNKPVPNTELVPRTEPVPNTELVPRTEPVPNTEPRQYQERNSTSTEYGTQNRKLTTNKPSLVKKQKNKKISSTTPEEFEVTIQMFDWAVSQGMPEDGIKTETEQFIDRSKSLGSKYIDWNAAWRTWIRNAVKFSRKRA